MGLVALRELRRAARKWRLRGQRLVLATFLFVVAGTVLMAAQGSILTVHNVAGWGRSFFLALAFTLLVLTVVLTPVQVIAALQRERDARTLELLTLTRVGPTRVLWGLLLAEAITLVLGLAGALPVLALVPSFGGVGVGEVALLGLTLPLMAGLLGVIATSVSLSSRSTAVAVVALVGWMLLFLVLIPARMAVLLTILAGTIGPDPLTLTALFPFTAYAAEQPGGIVGFAPWLVVAAWVSWTSTWRFRRSTGEGWAARGKSWPGPWLGWIPVVLFVLMGWGWMERSSAVADLDPNATLQSPEVTLAWASLALAINAVGSVLYLRSMAWLIPRLDLNERKASRTVWGPPVLWRELRTASAGALNRGLNAAIGGWAFTGLLVLALNDFDEEYAIMWTVLGVLLGALLTGVLTAASVAEERTRGTLPLLLTTTLPPLQIVLGKVVAVMVRLSPLVLAVAALTLWYFPDQVLGLDGSVRVGRWRDLPWGPRLLPTVPLLRTLALAGWLLAIWVTMSMLGLALSAAVKARSAAWTAPVLASLILPFGLVTLVFVLLTPGGRSPLREALALLVLPLPRIVEPGGGLPPELLAAAAVWSLFAVLATVVAVRALVRRQGR